MSLKTKHAYIKSNSLKRIALSISLLMGSTAWADPFEGSSFTLENSGIAEYDSMTVKWTATDQTAAGVSLGSSSSLTLSGAFNLTGTGSATPTGNQEALYLGESSVLNQTGGEFTVAFTAASPETTQQASAAVYADKGSKLTFGGNASITAQGNASELTGLRLYGSASGDSLRVKSINARENQAASMDGFAAAIWQDHGSSMDVNAVSAEAQGAGTSAG